MGLPRHDPVAILDRLVVDELVHHLPVGQTLWAVHRERLSAAGGIAHQDQRLGLWVSGVGQTISLHLPIEAERNLLSHPLFDR
jgi:hypothetical protein